jgi:hypothetical protein
MLLFNKSKVKKMDEANFPIEFNNELDDVEKSENEFYTLAVDRLSKLAFTTLHILEKGLQGCPNTLC